MMRSTAIGTNTEFLLRRLIDPLREFDWWVLLIPVVAAYVVLYLVMFFRQELSAGKLLEKIFVPRAVTTTATIVWGVYLLVYLVIFGVYLWRGVTEEAAVFENAIPFLMNLLLPLVIWPALVGLVTGVIMCVRRPVWLLGVLFVTIIAGAYLGATLLLPIRSIRFAIPAEHFVSWLVVLIPVELIAFFYIAMMYREDARTIHPAWAAFLGLLRACVYVILGAVFLLPARQTFTTRETRSKILVLFDVSDSMRLQDDVPQPGQDPKKLPKRQDHVVRFLTQPYRLGEANRTFLEHIQMKSPLTLYRFGGVLDSYRDEDGDPSNDHVKQLPEVRLVRTPEGDEKKASPRWAGQLLDASRLTAWLNPDRADIQVAEKIGDKQLSAEEITKRKLKIEKLYEELRSGTNVSGSALQALVRESNSRIQAVVIFSDGQSNLGSAAARQELHRLAMDPKRPIHIVTVGVGKYRPDISIQVGALRVPQQARPEDDFKVKVPVFGQGLEGRQFPVKLIITQGKMRGETWEPTPGGVQTVLEEVGQFKGGGERPYASIEFNINVRKLKGLADDDDKHDDELSGDWKFQAQVPRLPEETSSDLIHESRPAYVAVFKRKLRVLLFANGPSREYQFVRTIFYRESLKERVDLYVLLQQTAHADEIDQDVPKDHLLEEFPVRIGRAKNAKPGESLNDFDVIIAMDPDWSLLTKAQMELLKKWVRDSATAGGFIFVAGPVYSYQLARKTIPGITAVKEILPVKLKDNRLHSLGLDHDSTRPYVLNFPGNSAKKYGFLNLTDNPEDPLQGWKEFFWEGEKPPAGKSLEPYNGFYTYYPVESVQPGAEVVATFAGPPASRVNDGRDEQPFIALMPAGAGKSVYISSAELWRLRTWDEAYHRDFWLKLARFASSGKTRVSRFGVMIVPPEAPTGFVDVEALVLDADERPLPYDARPVVEVIRPADFNEKEDPHTPKRFKLKSQVTDPANHQGWFHGKFPVYSPGTYTLKIQVPGTSEVLTRKIEIFKLDPETSNRRPDPGNLYALATPAKLLFDERKNADLRRKLESILQVPVRSDEQMDGAEAAAAKSSSGGLRLYFDLSQAKYIPEIFEHRPPTRISTKGALEDLWDKGWGGDAVSLLYLLAAIAAGIGILLTVLLLFGGQWIAAALVFLGAAGLAAGLAGWEYYASPGWTVPLRTSVFWVLMVVPEAICLLVVVILITMQRWIFAAVMTGVTLAVAGLVYAVSLIDNASLQAMLNTELSIQMATVLAAVVGLLGVEWLCRKLLRLA